MEPKVEEVLEELHYLGRRMAVVLEAVGHVQATTDATARLARRLAPAIEDTEEAMRIEFTRAAADRRVLREFHGAGLIQRLKWALGFGTPPLVVYVGGTAPAFYRPKDFLQRAMEESARDLEARTRAEFERRVRSMS